MFHFHGNENSLNNVNSIEVQKHLVKVNLRFEYFTCYLIENLRFSVALEFHHGPHFTFPGKNINNINLYLM